jgi:enoyl-CoA hydratase/carnithine racemase
VAWQRQVLAGLKAAPVLHIGVVSGVALGWGTEYLLCCDYRIATGGSSFALPETGLGILPGAGGTSELWAHIGVAHTLRLGMTGERIQPDEACRIGLVQEVAQDLAAGLDRAKQLVDLVIRRSPTAVAAFKQSVLAAVGRDPSERHVLEEIAYAHCVDSGQAAVGRAHFADIRAGQVPPWGDRILLGGGDATS